MICARIGIGGVGTSCAALRLFRRRHQLPLLPHYDTASLPTSMAACKHRSTTASASLNANNAPNGGGVGGAGSSRAGDDSVGEHEVLAQVRRDLEELCADISSYAARFPHVQGTSKLLGRCRRELEFARQLSRQHQQQQQRGAASGTAAATLPAVAAEQQAAGSQGAAIPTANGAAASSSSSGIAPQLQGLRNNLLGLRAELAVAESAPGVVAVCKRFSRLPHDRNFAAASACSSGSAAAAAAAAGKNANSKKAKGAANGDDVGGADRETSADDDDSSVEVDVVALGGHAWIEVKGHDAFGIGSSHWHGTDTRGRGVRQQAELLLAVAAAPCNALRWAAPAVVLHFPRGADPGVAAELRALGAVVTEGVGVTSGSAEGSAAPLRVGGDGSSRTGSGTSREEEASPLVATVAAAAATGAAAVLTESNIDSGQRHGQQQQQQRPGQKSRAAFALAPEALPPPPPEPWAVNLDTTTLCVLCAEACNAPVGDARVAAWAKGNVHWTDCIEQEARGPRLLEQLAPYLEGGRPLIASAPAVEQFEALLLHAGPEERGRWQRALQRIQVVPEGGDAPTPPPATAAAAAAAACAGPGTGPEAAAQQQPQCAAPEANNPSTRPPGGAGRVAAAAAGLGLTPRQVATFELGDAARAVTLTANGRAVEALARRGVALEAVVHRPAWLSGI